MNAIEIKDVSKSYPGFELKGINLTLPEGCIMGLVGENGAGKSTLIKLIMNTISRNSGSVQVLGIDNQAPDFLNVKNDIGVVLDEAYFPTSLNAENVGSIMKDIYSNWDAGQYDRLLTHFKLPIKKAFKDYSRGMKMKLATAVALSHDAKLLILDEATSGLDPMIRDEILDIYNDFTRQENHSILMSSHIVSDLEKICDYIAFIHNGSVMFCEEKDRLQEMYGLVRLSQDEFLHLPASAVIGSKTGKYGTEALVSRAAMPENSAVEHATLEDIILYFAKGSEPK